MNSRRLIASTILPHPKAGGENVVKDFAVQNVRFWQILLQKSAMTVGLARPS
jgi:hypothetical protein